MDVSDVYDGAELTDYLISFVHDLDPNGGDTGNTRTRTLWPQYTLASPKVMTFVDGLFPLTVLNDDHRAEGMRLVSELSLEYPL